MVNKRELNKKISELTVLSLVTQAYADIASTRMKNIREFVLKNREFMGGVGEIFRQVLTTYKKEAERVAEKRGEGITFLPHNGKNVAVFLSAMSGLYGEIVPKVFFSFQKDVRERGLEATVVGKLGKQMFEEASPGTSFTYFDLPDYQPNDEEIARIVNHIVQYEEVHLYHGKYKTVVTQEVGIEKIAAIGSGEYENEEDIKYIFEPSLKEILASFESQIFSSLLDQTIRESQLAKFASRILAMSKASENVSQAKKKMRLLKLREDHQSINRKQVNSLAGVLLKGANP